MAKKFQALKFDRELEGDLKYLAGVKGLTYNAYVERILSGHVIAQRRAIRELAARVSSSLGDNGIVG